MKRFKSLKLIFFWRRKIAKNTCQKSSEADHTSIDSDESHESEKSDTAYYRDVQNIHNWNVENESPSPLNNSTEFAPWDNQLSFGHETLRESEAYKWLVSTVQRRVNMNGVEPSCMETHRQWLLKKLKENTPSDELFGYQKISRRKSPALYTTKFELPYWDLIGFLRDQEYPVEDYHAIVGQIITISGDNQFTQALSCKEYMEQIWPTTGADFVALLQCLVQTPTERQQRKSMQLIYKLVPKHLFNESSY